MVNKKIDKIDFIMRAAELINIRGYHFSSIDDIAKTCGLSKASVYNYIDSKQQLAVLILTYFHELVHEGIFKPVVTSGLPAEQKLVQLSQKLGAFYAARPGGCLMGNMALELIDNQPQCVQSVKRFFDEWINTLTRILAERLNFETAQRIAEDMTAQFQGALMLGRVYKNDKILERVLERIGSLLLVRDNVLVALSEC
ncbi:MAG: helix-turn-helix transcriptional regulator [Legionellales bacterium]|nr:helix-turn-helix transcriptional regulator [Legionellales bacterium]